MMIGESMFGDYDVLAAADAVARAEDRRLARAAFMAWSVWALFAFAVAVIVVGIGYMISALIGALMN